MLFPLKGTTQGRHRARLARVESFVGGARLLPTPTLHAGSATTGTSPATSFASASITPTADRLQLAVIASVRVAGSVGTPTASGCGLTWAQVATIDISVIRRITVFRALGASPTPGAVTFDWTGQTQDRFLCSMFEVSDTDLSGANGSGAIVQTRAQAFASGTGFTNTLLAALEHANNVNFTVVLHRGVGSQITPDADFSELSDINTTGTTARLETEWARNQIDCSPSWTTADSSAAISIEIKAGTS